MNDTANLKVGVCGLGVMGQKHARAISGGKIPGMQLTAVADALPGPVEALCQEVEGLQGYTDALAMIRSKTLDAVIIATPHFSHTPLGIAAFEAGLHVLVEKPISVHKADCEHLLEASKKSDGLFAVMFNRRADPQFQKVKHLITSGELGKINRMNWIVTDWFRSEAYYRSGDWRATWAGEGGGVLLNQCPHQLDLWQWLFGVPQRIRAFCRFGRFHDIEVEDDVTAFLEYEDGATGVFITSTGETPGTNRLEIAGERGRLLVENNQIHFLRNTVETTEFSRTTDSRFGRPDVWEVTIPYVENPYQHREVLINFSEAILQGKPLLAPGEEGIYSVEMGNAMLLSTWEDRAIELPLDSALFQSHLEKRIADSRYLSKD